MNDEQNTAGLQGALDMMRALAEANSRGTLPMSSPGGTYLRTLFASAVGFGDASQRSTALAYYDWQLRTGRVVPTVPLHETAPSIRGLRQFLKSRPPRIKQCYANAGAIALQFPNVKYVLGYATGVIPVAHAWNEVGGVHFDVTQDLAIGRAFGEHVAVVTLDAEELRRIANANDGVYPALDDVFHALEPCKSAKG